MKKKRLEVKEVFIGKLKPIGNGTYSKSFAKSEHKPLSKIYIDHNKGNDWY